jgi:hypothetical protein
MCARYLHFFCKFFLCSCLTCAAVAAHSEPVCQEANVLPSATDARYERNTPTIVTDKNTGLMWRICVEGKTGDQCETGTAVNASWGEALIYASNTNEGKSLDGYKDWRLPNIRELNSLVEVQCANPTINSRIFPNTPATHIWTSSPYGTLDFYSWYVDFSNGETNTDDRLNAKGIRLVRDADH